MLNHDRVLFSIREQRCGVANYEKDVWLKGSTARCPVLPATIVGWRLAPPVYQLKETLQLLLEYGVDCAQGYHIGLPSAVSEIQIT
ncbi:MAG: hypothetical protein EDM70_06085 [Candidatus Brocadia sp. AMX2]|uniref:hypothetical protein n=1 Tax=Candidatus Brocadia sinica TaxID=795830 RepID=UPI0012FF078C|nr:hypothetical protein [Candidatus Brocadia sinica]KAA0244605.1 MAG: hypothetical protein EDM70_06085 [Candidatus Brocadia sp. AMX2]MBC6932837.1 hypothetical protein [Candidatus Brocadia sp.]NOG41698.1 hypothetical protein [Planctomycetota bacterium]